MSEYIRTTRECSVNQLQPELLRTIQSYFEQHALGHLQSETLACCETISKKKKTDSWLSGKRDRTISTGILLTSEWLIWVHYSDESGILLNAANLKEIRASYHLSLLTNDASLEIAGYINGANRLVHGYIALERGTVAEKFCEEVREAINRVNPPNPNKPFRWLSGG